MSNLDDYLRDLKSLELNLDKIISNAILKNEGLILSRLKLRLFNKGTDGSGRRIEPEYSEITIERKKDQGQRSSFVTLRDTGVFYSSMYLEYVHSDGDLFVNSEDPKYIFLAEKYGDDILGLTIEDQNFIIFSIIEPEIIKELDKINKRNIDLI